MVSFEDDPLRDYRAEPSPSPTTFAESMALISEIFDQVRETANGIRVKMEADGYSPTASEQVALLFIHQTTMRIMGTQQ